MPFKSDKLKKAAAAASAKPTSPSIDPMGYDDCYLPGQYKTRVVTKIVKKINIIASLAAGLLIASIIYSIINPASVDAIRAWARNSAGDSIVGGILNMCSLIDLKDQLNAFVTMVIVALATWLWGKFGKRNRKRSAEL